MLEMTPQVADKALALYRKIITTGGAIGMPNGTFIQGDDAAVFDALESNGVLDNGARLFSPTGEPIGVYWQLSADWRPTNEPVGVMLDRLRNLLR